MTFMRWTILSKIIVSLVVAMAGAAWASNSAQAIVPKVATDSFCQGRYVHDYAQPFASMPSLHHLPSSGRLPFAPRRLEALTVGHDKIIAGAGELGMYISGPSTLRVDVNWVISARLTRIGWRGQRIAKPRSYVRHVDSVGGPPNEVSLGFRVGAKPAFYRFDVSFHTASGHHLGNYSEYFRVLRPRIKVDLGLSSRVYKPESLLLARLQNPGTVSIVYGYDFRIERWIEGSWVLDPATPKGWLMVGLGLDKGGMADCERFRLGGVPGLYRATKEYGLAPAGHNYPARAEFEIVE